MSMNKQFVEAGPVRLAVYTWGAAPTADNLRETLVLAHGFPDRALFWEKVALVLQDRFHVVAFDMRGCADSTHLQGARHYRYSELLKDLYAVIDAVSPGRKVHLVGHDWGGLYGWEAIVDPEGIRRIASFTTLSPSLEQVGFYLRRRMLKPTPRNVLQLFGQLMRNSLMTFFTLPLLPEFFWKSGLAVAIFSRLVPRYEHIPYQKNEGVEGDAIRYLGIYRANLLQRALMPAKRVSPVPVHAVLATRDPFLPPAVFEDSASWTACYTESRLDASHWAPLSLPVELAGFIAAHVQSVGSRALTCDNLGA